MDESLDPAENCRPEHPGGSLQKEKTMNIVANTLLAASAVVALVGFGGVALALGSILVAAI